MAWRACLLEQDASSTFGRVLVELRQEELICFAVGDMMRDDPCSGGAELLLFERGERIELRVRRLVVDLAVRMQRGEGLLLQAIDAAVELVRRARGRVVHRWHR